MLQEIGTVKEDSSLRSGKSHRLFQCDGTHLTSHTQLGDVRNAVCLLATESQTNIEHSIELVLLAGATSMYFSGPDATEHHMEADSIIISTVDKDGQSIEEQRGLVSTDGESCKSLEEGVWFFLNCASPTRQEDYDYLIVAWGSEHFKNRIIQEVAKCSEQWVDRNLELR